MGKRERQLSLIERWNIDVESYKQGAKVITSTPQCKKCKYLIRKNALYCEKFVDRMKPEYVLFPDKECEEFYHFKNNK